MFSKELQMLDESSVQYMIDEMQEEIDGMRGTIDEQQGKNESKSRSMLSIKEKNR